MPMKFIFHREHGKGQNWLLHWIVLVSMCALFFLFHVSPSHPYLLICFSVVATDDARIAQCCKGFGADVVMTSESCQNGKIFDFISYNKISRLLFKSYSFQYETTLGTERCNEALQKLEKKYDIVVNIQGDEPLIEPEIIDGIVKALQVIDLKPSG